ncbi:MAG TPA: UDP-N-acetylmuramate dehydrogenase, partial [Candidatus Paceibacterota bacterium]|nr:UDP-N-acetylmuramate dehydrogenase [Candidatus Paceibacterota bacterium]
KGNMHPLIKEGVFLSGETTFRIGGEARFFAEVREVSQIKEVIQFAKEHNLPIFFLGGGSNTVFKDEGHDGLIIKNRIRGIKILSENEDEVEIKAYAGEVWDEVVEFCVEQGFGGIENLTAIPGTLGGAIVQNIGAYGCEIKSVVQSVDVFDPKAKAIRTLSLDELAFGYRDSVFKKETHKDLFIVSATLLLKKHSVANLEYKDLKNFFEGRDASTVSISEVREALKIIRSKKFPDLSKMGTAGSFFKNSIVDKATVERLQKDYPDMPIFALDGGLYKLSSAWILDKVCGLRGMKEGNLGLFENQSLVVVNFENATSEELKKFISKIKKLAFEKIGVELQEEVIVL